MPLLAVLLLLPAPLASAATVVPASGGGVITSFVPTVLQSTAGVTILSVAATASSTGTFAGTFVAHFTCEQRAGGSMTCQGPEQFTGTTPGHSGTASFMATLTVDGNTLQGRTIITGGTAALGGELTFQGSGSSFTYSGRVILP